MARTRYRACVVPGCPRLTDNARCHEHTIPDRRPSRQARGYNAEHFALRKRLAPKVATGTVPCAWCHQPIEPGQAWDLGHTDDRQAWTGPEHARCNRSHHRTPTGGPPTPEVKGTGQGGGFLAGRPETDGPL